MTKLTDDITPEFFDDVILNRPGEDIVSNVSSFRRAMDEWLKNIPVSGSWVGCEPNREYHENRYRIVRGG